MKAYPLIWNQPQRFEKHIVLIGTFHIVCAYLKMIDVLAINMKPAVTYPLTPVFTRLREVSYAQTANIVYST
ncbi:hypothetical protein ACOMHN_005232 [Nucella lapillus]